MVKPRADTCSGFNTLFFEMRGARIETEIRNVGSGERSK